MSAPTPTVGRIVLVPIQTSRPGPDGRMPGPVEIRPAIVVRVFDGTCDQSTGMPLINVRVFTDGANDGQGMNTSAEWATSLHYSQDDHRPGTWHWMPYQIQTAPKA
jgi:hypothetical protein